MKELFISKYLLLFDKFEYAFGETLNFFLFLEYYFLNYCKIQKNK